MKITKAQKESVSLFESFAEKLASRVPKKTQPFFLALILGALLTIARRRTVTQWLKAAQISDDFRQAFYHIPNIGRNGVKLFDAMLELILQHLNKVIMASSKIRLVLDDSPTNVARWIAVGSCSLRSIRHLRPTMRSIGRQLRCNGTLPKLVSDIVGSWLCWS
jgi:hypothetical protein